MPCFGKRLKFLQGVTVSAEKVSEIISKALDENKEKLISDRYTFLFPLLAKIRQNPELKWANGGLIKEELDKQVLAILGPKDERDVVVKGKVRRSKGHILTSEGKRKGEGNQSTGKERGKGSC